MPLVILLDRLDGTFASLGSQGASATRGGFAHYQPFSDQPPNHALVVGDVFARLRDQGLRFGSRHPSFSNMGLTRIEIEPLGAGQFRFVLIYEVVTVGQFTANSAYIIEDGSVTQTYTTTFMPVTRQPIRVAWNAKSRGGILTEKEEREAGDSGEGIASDFVPMNLMRPVRTIQVSQIILGRPKFDSGDFVGYVNQDQWRGKPPGFWMLVEHRVRQSVYEGYFSVTATAFTKNTEDWSEFGVLQSTITGKKARIDDKAVEYAIKEKYSPMTLRKYNGFVRAMPYPWVSFRWLFGFS